FMVLLSCSDDTEKNRDIIIGKWRAIEIYDPNQLLSSPDCLTHIYEEYHEDHSVSGDYILPFPDECNSIQFQLGVVWENLENHTYRIGHMDEQGTVYTIFK